MRKAGHSGKLEYDQNVANRIQETSDNNRPLPTKRVNRGRNITYYNPPYHQLLLTNLSYTVRRITGECFTKDHILAKILNKNTIKTTYCTTPNMASKIRSLRRRLGLIPGNSATAIRMRSAHWKETASMSLLFIMLKWSILVTKNSTSGSKTGSLNWPKRRESLNPGNLNGILD